MNFAPYQDTSPEGTRALSPPPRGASKSPQPSGGADGGRRAFSPPPQAGSPGPLSPRLTASNGGETGGMLPRGMGGGGGRENVNVFETKLGFRMDYEACAAYLLLPPAGAVALLVTEQKSDYVRFHAWQSALLFSFLFVVHVIFSWSSIISWLIFIGDVGLMGWLTMRAYRDADTLDRCEVPFFGPLASSILDDE